MWKEAVVTHTKLSDFELEVLQLLWQLKEASTPELHQVIAAGREVSYSTVRTIVDRLEQKGAIERSAQEGRAISFRPLFVEAQVSKSLVQTFIQRVFAGEPRPLFSHLLENESLTEEDINYLESLLAKKKGELVRRK